MAEFAESRIQEMVPEMEEMERIGLMSSGEIKALVHKRRDYEYKLSRNKKLKKDFVDYILFDCKLLDLIYLRRKKMRMYEKSRAIETAICKRVLRKVRYLTRVWPADNELWALRISFSKSKNFFDEVSTSYGEQVQYHGNEESVWVSWANWEMTHRDNFHKARNILLSRASQYHPNSIFIAREYFRLELLYLEHLKEKSTAENIDGLEEIIAENREKVLKCAVPEAIYNDAVNKFPSAEVAVQFYRVAKKFTFAQHVAETIYRNLLSQCPCDSSTWQLKACREIAETNTVDGKEISQKPTQKLDRLLSIYDNAMEVVGNSFLSTYLNELLNQLFHTWGVDSLNKTILQKIIQLCNKYTTYLTPFHFLIWFSLVETCQNDENTSHKETSAENDEDEHDKDNIGNGNLECKDVITKAHSTHPSCPFIKFLMLKTLLAECGDDKSKMKIFERMNDTFSGSIGVRAWMHYIKSLESKDNIIAAYEKVSHHIDKDIAIKLRVDYLKYLFQKKGIKNTRKIYKQLKFAPPLSSELHSVYIEKELKSKFSTVGEVRQAFDTAILQFGAEQPGLWLTYIQFERKYGDPARVGYLQNEARDKLLPEKLIKFIDLSYVMDDQTETNVKNIGRSSQNKRVFVDSLEGDTPKNDDYLEKALLESVCTLFDEPPTLMYSVVRRRQEYFDRLMEYKTSLDVTRTKNTITKASKNADLAWESLISVIVGEPISFSLKEIKSHIETNSTKEFIDTVEERTENTLRKRKRDGQTEGLTLEDNNNTNNQSSSTSNDEITKILQTSETLKPGFMNKKQVLPYFLGRKEKRQKKTDALKPTDAGKGWFNMKTPRMTPEIKRDMKLIQMRSILDPKAHYKRNDLTEVPKHFQMGKIIDSPLDFYGSRIPKKQRKQTLAEELINDEKLVMYQKRKHQEIISQQQRKRKFFKSNTKEKKNQNKKEKKVKTK